MIVVGLDVSLTATGVARVDTDSGHVRVRTLSSGSRRGHARLEWIRQEILEELRGADFAGIEGFAFMARSANADEIYGLGHLVRHAVWLRRVPYAIVPPASLKLYVTGDGNSDKTPLWRELAKSFSHVDVGDDNQADALGIATMVLRHEGHPVDAHRLRWPHALEKCHWPDHDGEPRIIRKRKPPRAKKP